MEFLKINKNHFHKDNINKVVYLYTGIGIGIFINVLFNYKNTSNKVPRLLLVKKSVKVDKFTQTKNNILKIKENINNNNKIINYLNALKRLGS